MTSKTLTREDVIDAVIDCWHGPEQKEPWTVELLAEEIADHLGLTAPVPFERVAWARVWEDGSGSFYDNKRAAEDANYNNKGRVLPVLMQEISPDDPRLSTKERGEGE